MDSEGDRGWDTPCLFPFSLLSTIVPQSVFNVLRSELRVHGALSAYTGLTNEGTDHSSQDTYDNIRRHFTALEWEDSKQVSLLVNKIAGPWKHVIFSMRKHGYNDCHLFFTSDEQQTKLIMDLLPKAKKFLNVKTLPQ
jgi:hypothetical protein